MSRGDSDIKHLPDGVSFIKWMDNKAVHFISNFHGSEITNVNRKIKMVHQFRLNVQLQYQITISIWVG